jgi:hypothetical protein
MKAALACGLFVYGNIPGTESVLLLRGKNKIG